MSFKPIHDLESLTDQQREQYYLSACEYFQVPPELRLLDFMFMDTNDGRRNLVLYAKKGATDLIRANLKISITSTTRADGSGYVAFIVEGRDGNGRTEQAVGSAAIEGLRGQGLANAVMIAHTRATRRLTLQFVGGGLLDESEVNGPVTDINRAGGSLASLATLPAPIQPAGAPNTAVGKDITPISTYYESRNDFVLPPMVAPAPFSSGSIIPAAVERITETSQPLVQIEPALELKKLVTGDTTHDSHYTGGYKPPTEASFPTETKKRHRRTKAEMAATRGVISLDNPVSASAENPVIDAPKSANGDISESQRTATPIPDKTSEPVPTPVTPAVNPDTPSPAEVTAWKTQLSAYTDRQTGILAQGGMTENVFGKIRMYTMKLFPNAIVLPSKAIMLTNTQWKTLLDTFNGIVTQQGPAALVNAIEDAAKQ